MKVSIIEIQTITASEGMVLTNGTSYSDPGGIIYLGCNDIPENWYEITVEEAEQLQKVEEPLLDEKELL